MKQNFKFSGQESGGKKLPDDWESVAKAYGFPEYAIDFSDVSKADVDALIDFMRARINARTKENA